MRYIKATHGFSLIELLVVVTIIVVLLALLTPALDKAMEQAERAVCGANQRGVVSGAVMYGMENRKQLFICRGREVETTFVVAGVGKVYSARDEDDKVDWLAAMATVGLASSSPVTEEDGRPHHVPGKTWLCPSASYPGFWDPFWGAQYWTSYQYYGGIEWWRSQLGGTMSAPIRSRSPVSLSSSRGDWTLTADRSILFHQNEWSDGGIPRYWSGNPNHKSGEHNGPAGNNQGYMDGSVGWVDGRELINIHSYGDGGRQTGFFYQRDLGDWVPDEVAYARTYIVDNP